VRCDKELLALIDQWRSGVIPPETRAGALRWFARRHFLRLKRWRREAKEEAK
jgi:hypothetical protein